MIRYGPAGIPLSCKGRTLRDGIADIHHLGLTAMEVQFIKVNTLTRVVLDEEVGQTPQALAGQLVVDVAPAGKEPSAATRQVLTAPLKRRDSMTTLTWSLAKDAADLAQTRALARALDVDLTLHAPYYVDFFGSRESRERSMRQLQWSAILADGLGARLAVTHLGFYGTASRTESVDELTRIAGEVSDWMQKFSRGRLRLGVEPSGHPDVFGSREEVLELSHRVKGVVPVLNLPQIAARERAKFDEPGQLQPVVDQFREASHGEVYINFSGVEVYGTGEFRLTPIKRGGLRFDPLAELLADRDFDVSVISSSPLLEHDAMYMKLLYERALGRRWTRRHAAATKKAAASAPVPAAAARHPSKPAARRPKPAARRSSHESRSRR